MRRPISIICRTILCENRHFEKSECRALSEYQKAIELDPAYALAWAELASAHAWMCDFSGEIGGRLRRASASAREALREPRARARVAGRVARPRAYSTPF